MMNLINKCLGIFLGCTLLPLRVLAYHFFYTIRMLFIGIGICIGLPILLAVNLNAKGIPKVVNILLSSLLIFPITIVVTSIALATFAAYLTFTSLIKMIQSAWLGVKNGFNNGIHGFFQALIFQDTMIVNPLSQFEAGFVTEEGANDRNLNGFQRMTSNLQDIIVVHEDKEIPDIESSAPSIIYPLLSDNELKNIAKLLEHYVKAKTSLPLEKKQQLETMQILFMQYRDLKSKLQEVRLALDIGDKSKIKDELIPFSEVEIPILLIKQYKKDQNWYSVPAASYVTDKESFLTWLKHNSRHPLNQDPIIKPKPYNKMETRYIWYELTPSTCFSKELAEAAATIRTWYRSFSNTSSIAPTSVLQLNLYSVRDEKPLN